MDVLKISENRLGYISICDVTAEVFMDEEKITFRAE